jgi:hypothetical protein
MIRFLPTLLFSASALIAHAQTCQQFPAPCPNSSSISDAMDLATRSTSGRFTHQLLEEEFAMENRMRSLITDEVQRAARKLGWHAYEQSEITLNSGPFVFIGADDWQATPLEKRPPHTWEITFILIKSRDSLNAWRDWLQRDGEEEFSKVMEARDSTGIDPRIKQCQDSMAHYLALETDYISQHSEEASKSDAASEAFNRKVDFYQSKVDHFSQQANDIAEGHSAESIASLNDADAVSARYAEGSMALLHFAVNPYGVTIAAEDGAQVKMLPPGAVPGAFAAGIATDRTEPQHKAYALNYNETKFIQPRSSATVLLGRFGPKNKFNKYVAQFAVGFTNKQNTLSGVKAVRGDKVQTIAVDVQGGQNSVAALLKTLDWHKLAAACGQ